MGSADERRVVRARSLAALLAALLLGCIAEPEMPPPPPTPEEAGEPASLQGRLVAAGERLSAAELTHSLVYLEPIGTAPSGAPPGAAELRHREARLAPNLLAVAPGDPLWLVNDDRIFHGAFSYSRPNSFDLGAYGPGERRQIHFAHRGAVRIHCPFHPEESSVVVVVPTRLVVRPTPQGGYQISGAAAGRYWLKAWADGLPEVAYDVTLQPGENAFRDIEWAGEAPPNAASGAVPAGPAP